MQWKLGLTVVLMGEMSCVLKVVYYEKDLVEWAVVQFRMNSTYPNHNDRSCTKIIL
jgi:hypothetical protein